MIKTYVALGANLGEPLIAFQYALERVNAHIQCSVEAVSSVYCSKAFEAEGPDYLNAVALVMTALSAPELLMFLQEIELDAGRIRAYHHQPRTLDLDLLFYAQGRIDSATLKIPHPRWRERAFVLLPLQEISETWVREEDVQAVKSQSIERLGPLLWHPRP
jgi:2-amino-4-hydroxy-6-hydroxymethyldihydropteridine diphosphokinase